MFTLLSDIYATWNRKEEYSVLILGLDNAGKTTLLENIKSQNALPSLPPERITPTIGQNGNWLLVSVCAFCLMPTVGKLLLHGTRFQFWDLGGQASLRTMWNNYYSSAHLILFVIDSSSPSRLQESCSVLRELSEDEGVKDLPMLILANKQDSDEAMAIEMVKEEVNQLINKIDPKEGVVLGCSALTGEGVMPAVEWMLSRVLRNKSERPPMMR